MSVNTVPEKLTAFRVYQDGYADLIGIADVQLPSLQNLTETVKGAGIAGEYDSPTIGHFQSMKISMNWRTVTRELLKFIRQRAQRLDLRGAFQEYDAANGSYQIKNMRVVVQTLPSKVDLGKLDIGAKSDGATEVEVIYIKVEIDGNTVIEIDKLNYICIIDGEDYLADVRSALGL